MWNPRKGATEESQRGKSTPKSPLGGSAPDVEEGANSRNETPSDQNLPQSVIPSETKKRTKRIEIQGNKKPNLNNNADNGNKKQLSYPDGPPPLSSITRPLKHELDRLAAFKERIKNVPVTGKNEEKQKQQTRSKERNTVSVNSPVPSEGDDKVKGGMESPKKMKWDNNGREEVVNVPLEKQKKGSVPLEKRGTVPLEKRKVPTKVMDIATILSGRGSIAKNGDHIYNTVGGDGKEMKRNESINEKEDNNVVPHGKLPQNLDKLSLRGIAQAQCTESEDTGVQKSLPVQENAVAMEEDEEEKELSIEKKKENGEETHSEAMEDEDDDIICDAVVLNSNKKESVTMDENLEAENNIRIALGFRDFAPTNERKKKQKIKSERYSEPAKDEDKGCCDIPATNTYRSRSSIQHISIKHIPPSQKFMDSHCHLDYMRFRVGTKYPLFDTWMEMEKMFVFNPRTLLGCVWNIVRPEYVAWGFEWMQKMIQEAAVLGVSVGCHPHYSNQWEKYESNHGSAGNLSSMKKFVTDMLDEKKKYKVCAIGECGLDTTERNKIPMDEQLAVLKEQLCLARDHDLPVVIHCRGSGEDEEIVEEECIWAIKEILGNRARVHRHCFFGGWKTAQKWMDAFPECVFGFTPGIVNSNTRQIHAIDKIPLTRIVLETDAPFFNTNCHKMAPQSSRVGSKYAPTISHPHQASVSAEFIARVKQISVQAVMEVTLYNTLRFYGLDRNHELMKSIERSIDEESLKKWEELVEREG